MILKVFLLFLLNHVVFDFIFQGKSIIKKRFPKELDLNNKKSTMKKLKVTINGNIIHSIFHLLGMLIIIIFIKVSMSFKLIIFIKAILITVGHFFTDEIKSLIILYKSKYRNNIWLFITDQISHFLIIALAILGLNNLIKVYEYNLDNTNKLLIALIVFLVVTIVTGIFIKIFINDLMPEKSTSDAINAISDSTASNGAKNGGFIIGILERILIFISMLIDYYSIIGFILTAKSIARFNKLSDQRFAEYFIIGNLISFTSSIIGGVFVKFIINL